MSATVDAWRRARARYEAGDSLRAIAADVGVSHVAVLKRAQREEWERGPGPPAPVTASASTRSREKAAPASTAPAEAVTLASPPTNDDGATPPSFDFSTAEGWAAYRAALQGVDAAGQRRLDAAFARLDEEEAFRRRGWWPW